MSRTAAWTLVGMLAIAPLTMLAQGGPTCGTATPIACGATVNGNTTGVVADVAPACGSAINGNGGGVWFRFTGTGNAVTASLCGSAFDTQIRVFTGICSALTCAAGDDDFCGLQSQVTWNSLLSTTYFILVHGFGDEEGAFTLTMTCAPPPNSMCYEIAPMTHETDVHAGTQVFLSDDTHSGAVPIGFSFCFSGANYTQCVISSNNYITFNTAMANQWSPWTTVAVPNTAPTEIRNTILSPWQDINPATGGTIRYQTLGVAPNRRFVVSYQNVPMFSCTGLLYSSQTVLYEGTNCIATRIITKPICSSWNSGNAVHALHNNAGTMATVVPGRNNTAWTTSNQTTLFVPTCGACSTATSADCLGIILPIQLAWFRGHASGPMNVLEWSTASEENTAYFLVERSEDLESFEAILELPAAGNSLATIEYRGEDPFPLPGVNYYRLRTVDLDGSTYVSDVFTITRQQAGGVSVWPNPAKDVVYVGLPESLALPAEVRVLDLAGRVVRELRLHTHAAPTAIIGLAPGSYLLDVPALGPGSSKVFMVE